MRSEFCGTFVYIRIITLVLDGPRCCHTELIIGQHAGELHCSIDLHSNKLVTFQPSPRRPPAQFVLAPRAEVLGNKSAAVKPTTLV